MRENALAPGTTTNRAVLSNEAVRREEIYV